MEDRDARFIGNQLWRQLYEAAFFELDPKLLAPKIADAQKAMGERALALLRDDGHNHSEKEALARAYFTLDDLKIIYETDGRVA